MAARWDVAEKIRSDDLREAVAHRDTGSHVVVVEVASGATRLETVDRRQSTGIGSRFRFAEDQSNLSAETLNETRIEVERIIERPVESTFASSRSLVVEADGGQLQQIAELPGVKAIWPNTRLR